MADTRALERNARTPYFGRRGLASLYVRARVFDASTLKNTHLPHAESARRRPVELRGDQALILLLRGSANALAPLFEREHRKQMSSKCGNKDIWCMLST